MARSEGGNQMQRILIAIALIALVTGAAQAADSRYPSVVHGTNARGQTYTDHFYPGGRIVSHSVSPRDLRTPISDTGRWWIRTDGRRCWQFQHWMNGAVRCSR
jgi:hypothetical protein